MSGGGLVGRTYLERGRPVVVVTGWGEGGGPRNVAVRRADGTVVVRPLRGLRRSPVRADAPSLGQGEVLDRRDAFEREEPLP